MVSYNPEYRSELIAEAKKRDGVFVKTARVLAIRLPVEFIVQTEHGPVTGHASDWLATNHPDNDSSSDIWPISAARFAASYVPAADFGTLQAALEAEAKTLGEVAGGEVAGEPVPLIDGGPSPVIDVDLLTRLVDEVYQRGMDAAEAANYIAARLVGKP